MYTYMTNSQKGVPVGFLPLKTLNNFLRIKHKDIYFCSMMHFEVVIAYMQKEITYIFRFSFKYVFLWQKMSFFQRKKRLILERGVFWQLPFQLLVYFLRYLRLTPLQNGWGTIFCMDRWVPTENPWNMASQKISVSLHISVNFHLQH